MSLRPNYKRLATICFAMSWIVARWPILLVVISLISPVSPHYRLTDADGYSCAYGGVRGIIYEYDRSSCSIIALVDTRGRGQW